MFHSISSPSSSQEVSSLSNPCARRSSFKALWLLLSCVTLSGLGALPAIGQAAPRATIPSFTSPIERGANARAFESFINSHRGKLVHLNTSMSTSFSQWDKESNGTTDLFVSEDPCEESEAPNLNCLGAYYFLSGRDFTLTFYQNHNVLVGYFVIDENREMHQGTYYGLKSIPAAQVLLGR